MKSILALDPYLYSLYAYQHPLKTKIIQKK